MFQVDLDLKIYYWYSYKYPIPFIKINILFLLHLIRGHNITFLSGFPADNVLQGLEEVAPLALVEFIANFTTYDLLGARLRNQMPISAWDAIRYPIEVRDVM